MNFDLRFNNNAAKSLESCLILCDSIEGSPPGSAIPGVLQERTLEWVAISFSNVITMRGLEKNLCKYIKYTFLLHHIKNRRHSSIAVQWRCKEPDRAGFKND